MEELTLSSIFYETVKKSAFFYEDSNIVFPGHLHRQLEIFYLLSGQVDIKLGTRKFTLHKDDVLLVLPNVIHSYESIGNSRFYIGLTEPRQLGKTGKLLENCECLNPVNPISAFHPEALHIMNVLAMQNKKEITDEHEERTCGYLRVLADYFTEALNLVPSESSSQDDILKPILNYILGHYRDDLSLDLVAREVGINKYHLSKLFAEKIGHSFPGYLMMLRVDYAKELLLTTYKKMDEIAFLCGFQSESSFFRNFRRITGMTPLQFRNACSKASK